MALLAGRPSVAEPGPAVMYDDAGGRGFARVARLLSVEAVWHA